MKNTRKNRGSQRHTESVTHYVRTDSAITLVGLVVTIITLLILAGVSISLVTGSNGLIGKARSAVAESQKAKAEEEVRILMYEWQIENAMNQTSLADFLTSKGSDITYRETGSNGYQILTNGYAVAYKNFTQKTLEPFQTM